MYGLNGLLYGEYTNAGVLIREYVHLNDAPLAQIDAGTPEELTYLHPDHLGTPKYGTNAGGTQVWAANADAFGVGTPSGSATVNLRMPGQYYDSESGLFYNWNRYYSPSIGRYISSDPIGQEGGLNTFNYAESSPVMFIDPEGLEPNASCVARYTTCFAAIGGMIGAVSGGVGGGAAGSVVPVAGTAAGAIGGSQMGAAGGAALGAGVGYYAGNAMCPAEPIYMPSDNMPAALGGATIDPMAKQSKKSGKEKASDVPSFAEGYGRDPNENCHEYALSILIQQYGATHPKVYERGAGSEYQKIKKWCERSGR